MRALQCYPMQFLAVIGMLALAATAKSSPPTRTGKQIYLFQIEDRQTCDDLFGGCANETGITACEDNTWCYLNYQCGTFFGQKGCCLDMFSGDKNVPSNQSCTAKMDVLSNLTWSPSTSNVSTVLPSWAFCNMQQTLPSYPLAGPFDGPGPSGAGLQMGPDGQVCCPNILDSVIYHANHSIPPTQAICIAPFGVSVANLLDGNGSGNGTTGNGTGKHSGAPGIKFSAWRDSLPLPLLLLAGPLMFLFA